jgi:hypothetical protein
LLKDAEAETAPPPSREPAPKQAAPVQPKPKPSRDTAWALCQKARQLRKSDADAALGMLQQALGQYPQYKVDIYHHMAMCVEEHIRNAGVSATKSLLRQKLDYLLKAKEAIDAGGKGTLEARPGDVRAVSDWVPPLDPEPDPPKKLQSKHAGGCRSSGGGSAPSSGATGGSHEKCEDINDANRIRYNPAAFGISPYLGPSPEAARA